MAKAKFVIGLDFGTDSVRSLIADVSDGKEIATSVSYYKRWGKGLYCDPSKNQFRHHPADYKESMTEALTEVINMSPKNTAENIIGIGVDTTGSTPAPVDREGKILAEIDRFADDPDAMFVLWKDHSAVEEAEHINDVSRSWGGIDYTKYSGGVYSSEWFFSKIPGSAYRKYKTFRYKKEQVCRWAQGNVARILGWPSFRGVSGERGSYALGS